jgi:hypothetical protein
MLYVGFRHNPDKAPSRKLTFNVELASAALLYRVASRERSERGRPPGWRLSFGRRRIGTYAHFDKCSIALTFKAGG